LFGHAHNDLTHHSDRDYSRSYYGSIAIGTPPVAYNVIVDSGSADLFLVGSGCTSQACSGIPSFDSSKSSSFSSSGQAFSITYGSGEASGTLGKDVVQMAGFQVSQQTFGMSFPHPYLFLPESSLTIFSV
jgi:cathepsin D